VPITAESCENSHLWWYTYVLKNFRWDALYNILLTITSNFNVMIFHYISDVLYSKIDVFLEATQNFSPNLKNINLDKLT
jgi:hypothetical protein